MKFKKLLVSFAVLGAMASTVTSISTIQAESNSSAQTTNQAPEKKPYEVPKVSLKEAVEKALTEVKDGRILSIQYDNTNDKVAYTASIIKDSTLHFMKIDVNDGSISEKIEEDLSKNPAAKDFLNQKPKYSVEAAIDIAQKAHPKANLMTAELIMVDPSKAEYHITLKDGDKTRQVKVDATKGAVTADEEVKESMNQTINATDANKEKSKP